MLWRYDDELVHEPHVIIDRRIHPVTYRLRQGKHIALVPVARLSQVSAEKLTVRSYCTWLNLLTLYEIGAFRGTKSWTKLLCSLEIAIAGRQTRGHERIRELSRLETITSRDVYTRYRIGSRAANLWLVNMQRQGLVERSTMIQTDRYNRYGLTQHGKTAIRLIDQFEREYDDISQQHASTDPESILSAVKTKTGVRLRSTEEGTQTCKCFL